MTDSRAYSRVIRKRKKRTVPLSKLRMSDAVKIISDSPRRLEELLRMLEDPDRCIRDKAAATLALLAKLHPSRLLNAVFRFNESLADESAYVRWHIAHTLGLVGSKFPSKARAVLPGLAERLDDPNRIVRIFACKALARIYSGNPKTVREFFQDIKRELPPQVADIIHRSGPKVPQ